MCRDGMGRVGYVPFAMCRVDPAPLHDSNYNSRNLRNPDQQPSAARSVQYIVCGFPVQTRIRFEQKNLQRININMKIPTHRTVH